MSSATIPQQNDLGSGAQRLIFQGPCQLTLENFDCPQPGPGEVLIKSRLSAISSGTEKLVWQGEIPDGMQLDSNIPGLRRPFAYPLTYGYALVGQIAVCGPGLDAALCGRRVFGFWPHQSALTVPLSECHFLPDNLADADAAFIASMETAINLMQDSALVLGDRLAIFGLGTIGLLCALVATKLGLSELVAFDPLPARRALLKDEGLVTADPSRAASRAAFDVVIELSGNPEALNSALAACAFSGKVILGSWYGKRPMALILGGEFHRSRISVLASQVSTINPSLSGRWTKERRLELAMAECGRVRPSRLITHQFELAQAREAYQLMCDQPNSCSQILFRY